MLLIVFACLLVIPFAGGALTPRKWTWVACAGVLPATAWWALSYAANIGSNDVTNTRLGLIAFTGLAAAVYLLVWLLLVAAGWGVGLLIRHSARRARADAGGAGI